MFVPDLVYDDLENDYLNQKKLICDQIDYSCYLGLPSLSIKCPSSSKTIAILASIINSKLCLDGGLAAISQIWFHFNLSSTGSKTESQNNQINKNLLDKWENWNQLRNHLIKSRKIGITLELKNDNDLPDNEQRNRWAGEPVCLLILNTSLFLINKKGFPVLSKNVQNFVTLLRLKTAFQLHLMIRGKPAVKLELSHYYKYLKHLKSLDDKDNDFYRYAAGYEDYLQIPLQPLMDNLESTSYEVFEKDPVKYKEYQRAITKALEKFQSNDLVLMVVGAGRGPLVTESILAASSIKKKLKIYAIEKNKNAIPTLNYLKKSCWDRYDHVDVEIICVDMREFNPIRKADVIVSELLGSFGDNELSPECLDGLWKCSKETTISIPQTYTSYIAPLMSYKLHTRTAYDRNKTKPFYNAFENQYVVYLKNFYLIDRPKKLFTFDHLNMTIHPNQKDNRRFATINFKSKLNTILHGFGGYFEATLFDDIKLSTVYNQETDGMFSWFPLWIPLLEPISVRSNDDIELMFWRNVDKQKVWYEWTVSSPSSCQIHNINGRSQFIGL